MQNLKSCLSEINLTITTNKNKTHIKLEELATEYNSQLIYSEQEKQELNFKITNLQKNAEITQLKLEKYEREKNKYSEILKIQINKNIDEELKKRDEN